jgi:GxxExxY protein
MNTEKHDLILKDECYRIIGACMEVHNELGAGFLEPVYPEALAIEFEHQGIPFVKENRVDIYYKGRLLDRKYSADFLCFNQVLVELKALEDLTNAHLSQILNYLKGTNLQIGLLVNFGKASLQYKRVVYG